MSAPIDRKANAFCAHSIGYNELGPEGGSALAEGIKGNSSLTSLKYRLLDTRTQIVFAFLSAPIDRKANTFCARSIGFNNLGPEGGAAIAEGLKGNSTLTSLE